MSILNTAILTIIGLAIIAAIAQVVAIQTSNGLPAGSDSAVYSSMPTGSETPQSGMIKDHAAAGQSGDEMPIQTGTPASDTRQMQDGEPVIEPGAVIDVQAQYTAKQGTSGSAR